MDDKYEVNSRIFKALSDVNRLKIIDLLSYEEKCGCKILEHFNFTQPTLSHHMKVLIECGLVEARKCGTWSYYKIKKGIQTLSIFLNISHYFFNVNISLYNTLI